MLWTYSFAGALKFSIPNTKVVCVFVLIFVILFELLQYLNLINGTGDLLDILFSLVVIIAFYFLDKFLINGG